MTQGIGGYRDADTDELLRRVMEDSGDHDPSRIQSETGRPLHFDATRSASLHRAGMHGDRESAREGLDEAWSQARDRAIEQYAELAEHIAPALGAIGIVSTAVFALGEGYSDGIEKPHREGEAQWELGASDAGVVAVAQTLEFDPEFKQSVAQAHAGSDNVAAAMTAKLGDDAHAPMRKELQVRADRGFVDAAGYAKMAARAIEPLQREARERLEQARDCTDPARAKALVEDASVLTMRAGELEKKYLAPVMSKAKADAANGLGVEYAMHMAVNMVHAGETPAAVGGFDAAFARANANVLSDTPPTCIRG